MTLQFATAFPLRLTEIQVQGWCLHFGLKFEAFASTPDGFEVEVGETVTPAAQEQIAAALSAILAGRLITAVPQSEEVRRG